MESVYMKFNDPDLRLEKEFVYNLVLFWCTMPPTRDDIIAFITGVNIGLKFTSR